MRRTSLRQLVLACLASSTVACASTPGAPPAQQPTGSGELTNAEMEAIIRARRDSARMRFTEADVRFMNGMIHHHAQAIEVSRLVPERTTTPSIRTLAARIINAQQDEIETMQRWLRDRDQPVPDVDTGQAGHGGHDMHMPGMRMAGMLTADQIATLERLRGPEFDRMFLTLLIEHHRGAVEMVHELFATDGAGQDEDAFRLASDIQVDQVTEVARMERMLAAMTGGVPDES